MNVVMRQKGNWIYVSGDVLVYEKELTEIGMIYDIQDNCFFKASEKPEYDMGRIYVILRFNWDRYQPIRIQQLSYSIE